MNWKISRTRTSNSKVVSAHIINCRFNSFVVELFVKNEISAEIIIKESTHFSKDKKYKTW